MSRREKALGLVCVRCHHRGSTIVDTRKHTPVHVNRVRKCDKCGYRFQTREFIVDPFGNPINPLINERTDTSISDTAPKQLTFPCMNT